jgi:hypothetical protein
MAAKNIVEAKLGFLNGKKKKIVIAEAQLKYIFAA